MKAKARLVRDEEGYDEIITILSNLGYNGFHHLRRCQVLEKLFKKILNYIPSVVIYVKLSQNANYSSNRVNSLLPNTRI